MPSIDTIWPSLEQKLTRWQFYLKNYGSTEVSFVIVLAIMSP